MSLFAGDTDMKFKMSPNVAVRTVNPEAAFDFYSKVLGFAHRPNNDVHTDLDAEPLNLFIIEDSEFSGVVMELFVEDLEAAKEELLANGCRVIRWEGKGRDCYLQDPFGITYNLWEETGPG
jgi:catechol 2,3-dioxygenase-like lactoylglutathione lyase family enzyme